VICVVLADLFFTSSLCIALAQAAESSAGDGDAARAGAIRGALRALRGALSNPLPWAIALGVLFSAADWQLPGPVDTVVRMLADAATPVALFTIGALLHRAGQHAHTRTPPGRYLPVAAIKLVLHPALVFVIAASAHTLGAGLTPLQVTAMTLGAALPSASNVSLLAERFGADNGRIARVILVSTALSFFTFSAAVTLLT
jgi:predicted permease